MRNEAVAILLFLTIVVAVAHKRQLVVLHTNDVHSCIMPLGENIADTALAGRGGFLRRMALVEEERMRNPRLLLVDSGDFSQGSPYYTLFKGDVEIGLMNLMGYDVAVIGNHEFDFGLDNMARIFRMANFPVLCSNYDFSGTVVDGLVKRYAVIVRDGVRIGFFALCPDLEGLVDTTKCVGVKFLDPVEVAREMSLMLKKEKKCDVVVCISHLGWDMKGCDDQKVVAETRGIDLVLGGHSHTYMDGLKYVKNLDGKDIPVDQNGKYGIWIGKIVLDIER